MVKSRSQRMKTLGGRVQQARLDAGLSQAQLAKKVGCQKLCILKLEADETQPKLGTFTGICATLGVSMDAMVYGK